MSDLAKAVARLGVLDENMLRQITKWGLPAVGPDGPVFTSSEEACAAIEEATESVDQVAIRVADPDVMKQYMATKRQGKLRIVKDDEKADFEWEFGKRQVAGFPDEYILQWTDNVDTDLLTNGESYLLDGKTRVYFSAVQDVYFGDKRVFVVCTPRKAA